MDSTKNGASDGVKTGIDDKSAALRLDLIEGLGVVKPDL